MGTRLRRFLGVAQEGNELVLALVGPKRLMNTVDIEKKHKVPPAYSRPNPRKSGAVGDPGSRADLPIHAKSGREWGP